MNLFQDSEWETWPNMEKICLKDSWVKKDGKFWRIIINLFLDGKMDLTRIDREAIDEDQTDGQDILRKIR